MSSSNNCSSCACTVQVVHTRKQVKGVLYPDDVLEMCWFTHHSAVLRLHLFIHQLAVAVFACLFPP